jgi:tRNA(Ile)-lysidine synthase
VESLDALLTSWHGQGPLSLPGYVQASRSGDLVTVAGVTSVR